MSFKWSNKYFSGYSESNEQHYQKRNWSQLKGIYVRAVSYAIWVTLFKAIMNKYQDCKAEFECTQ